jgi:hypothetical protein
MGWRAVMSAKRSWLSVRLPEWAAFLRHCHLRRALSVRYIRFSLDR